MNYSHFLLGIDFPETIPALNYREFRPLSGTGQNRTKVGPFLTRLRLSLLLLLSLA
jgi:hypothetical protein